MKKIIITSALLLSGLIFAQNNDYLLKIEVDNTYQRMYDAAYSKASSEWQKKENADLIKGKADAYFNELEKLADYVNQERLSSKAMVEEFSRLKGFGQDILNLLILLNQDELTSAKTNYTIKKAYDELSFSLNGASGKLRYIITENVQAKAFSKLSDEELITFIAQEMNETRESISNYCNGRNVPRKLCLVSTLMTAIEMNKH